MHFPTYRLRRLRKDDLFRRVFRETQLRPDDFILPLFVRPGKGIKQPISSMPGHFQLSIDLLIKEVREAKSLGIPGVILFGIPEKKDEMGSEGYAEEGIIQKAVSAIKEKVDGVIVITDVCLCEYTSHGHCGVIRDGKVINDETLELLGPMREIELDIEEGADMIMVKPAMPYLDVIAAARERFDLPLAAYQVSGEYAMIEAAARNNWIDRERVMMESLVCIRRAGASIILTYFAKDAAKLLA